MDRLSTLLAQFGMHATTFYAGLFSGELAYDSQDRSGRLYLLNTGKARLHAVLIVCEYSVLQTGNLFSHGW